MILENGSKCIVGLLACVYMCANVYFSLATGGIEKLKLLLFFVVVVVVVFSKVFL